MISAPYKLLRDTFPLFTLISAPLVPTALPDFLLIICLFWLCGFWEFQFWTTTEPMPLSTEAQSTNHWIARKFSSLFNPPSWVLNYWVCHLVTRQGNINYCITYCCYREVVVSWLLRRRMICCFLLKNNALHQRILSVSYTGLLLTSF